MSRIMLLIDYVARRRLRNLSLAHCNVETVPAVLSSLTALSKLCMDSCFECDDPNKVSAGAAANHACA